MNTQCNCQYSIRSAAGASDKDRIVIILGFNKDLTHISRNISEQTIAK